MTRDELFEHMLSDPYHNHNRKLYLRELRDRGTRVRYEKRTLREGFKRAKAIHASDHSHPDHEH